MVRTYFFVRTMIAASCLLLNSLAVAECNASPLSGQNAQKVAKHRGEATFRRLRPGVWLHATYMPIGSFGPVVSYGLVIERKDHALLIDSGWNDTQTKDILDWARHDLEKPVTIGIFTHSHNDKMGGVAAVEASGARTLAHPLSNEFASWRGVPTARESLDLFKPGDVVNMEGLEIFFPGAGHTLDNIVVYDAKTRILHGGCLLRSMTSRGKGNTADADLSEWSKSVERLIQRYPDAEIVTVSHGEPAGPVVLEHSRAIVSQTMMFED